MKTYEEINKKIQSGKAMVLTAEEVIGYVEQKGLEKAAEDIDVVTTATFGPMCSSGCFLNFGHSKPKMRMTDAWLDDVYAYSGIAAVDVYLGATQLRQRDPANMNYPGEFRFGGGHVIEKLVAGEDVELRAESYGTDEYPLREIRTWININDLNQATMVNPRNCYQNYNVAINCGDKMIHTYLGTLKPHMKNLTYCSAGQLSPLLNDPHYKTIGLGSAVWLAGAKGHVYAEGTQFASACERTPNGVPVEGSGTLALTADMKQMNKEFVRGLSLKGYGVSLSLGIGIPIPILNKEILEYTTVKDEEILACVIDYSKDYPEKNGRVITKLSYSQLKTGEVVIEGKKVKTGSLSSYAKARKIAGLLKEEIQKGDFLLNRPFAPLPPNQSMGGLEIRKKGASHDA